MFHHQILSSELLSASDIPQLDRYAPAVQERIKYHSDTVSVLRIVYQSVAGHRVEGFVLLPKVFQDKLPVILWNRGGHSCFGLLTPVGLWYRLARFAAAWYAIWASQYSGSPESEGTDQMGGADVDDIETILQMILEHPDMDPNNIFTIGFSRGATMSYLLLKKKRDAFRGCVTIGGSVDYERVSEKRPNMREVFQKTFGGWIDEMRKRSAILWADQLPNISYLLLHGEEDDRVEPDQSVRMAAALQSAGITDVTLRLFPDEDHMLTQDADTVDIEILEWIAQRRVKE